MSYDLASLQPRFWRHVDASSYGCWPWLMSPDGNGYGQLRVDGKNVRAHRLSYILNVGEIPPGMIIMHLCDNRICVRPDHLRLGSNADNLADCRSKGRWTNKKKEKEPRERLPHGPVPRDPSERLWDKVQVGKDDECWPFMGKKVRQGYGRIGIGRTQWVYAHRVAFVIANGPIPDGLIIMHTCDNPPCCNPKHLVAGTRKDNNQDRANKKRGREHRQYGEANANVKIKDADLPRIRELYAEGKTQMEIAALFGVKQPQISRILRGNQRSS